MWKKFRRPIGANSPLPKNPIEREVAEPLADQRHVVVGDAEEPAPAAGAVEVAAEGRPPAAQARRHLVEHRPQILARGLGVADLELHGLAHPHALGDRQRPARLIGADEVAHEEVAPLERRLGGIHREAGEDAGALDARLGVRQRADRLAQHLERRTIRDPVNHVGLGCLHRKKDT